jgi:hypothetical protein
MLTHSCVMLVTAIKNTRCRSRVNQIMIFHCRETNFFMEREFRDTIKCGEFVDQLREACLLNRSMIHWVNGCKLNWTGLGTVISSCFHFVDSKALVSIATDHVLNRWITATSVEDIEGSNSVRGLVRRVRSFLIGRVVARSRVFVVG